MSFLKEIQEIATDSKTDLTSLLRKCKILATRLGSAEFRIWVDNELSGYKSVDDLPEYRILQVPSKGNFFGPHGSGYKNAEIPLSCIPEKYKEQISHTYLKLPIAAIEILLKNSDKGEPRHHWTADFVRLVNELEEIYPNMRCMEAWKVLPVRSYAVKV